MIEHTARRADHHFGAAPQRPDLVIHRGAAVDGHDVQVRALRVLVERLGDLHRQFARRHQHERARPAAIGLQVAQQPIEQRQRERGRLAGPGRGLAEHVAAREQHRNRFTLNGCGFFVAERRDGGNQRVREAERRKACSIAGGWSLHENRSRLLKGPCDRYSCLQFALSQLGVARLVEFAGSKGQRLNCGVDFRRRKHLTISIQENNCDGEARPFVAIDERMVLHHTECISSGQLEYCRLAVGREVLRSSQCRFEEAAIANTGRATELRQKPLVGGQDHLFEQPDRRLHFASSRSVRR